MERVSRKLVQYYVALRLSAGAAMLYMPFEVPSSRDPIVRASTMEGPAGFDRREVIVRGGRVSVVTLPLTRRLEHSHRSIGLN